MFRSAEGRFLCPDSVTNYGYEVGRSCDLIEALKLRLNVGIDQDENSAYRVQALPSKVTSMSAGPRGGSLRIVFRVFLWPEGVGAINIGTCRRLISVRPVHDGLCNATSTEIQHEIGIY